MEKKQNINKESQSAVKKPVYAPPKVQSESIFEKRALGCGKCRGGPHRQHQCMRLPSVS